MDDRMRRSIMKEDRFLTLRISNIVFNLRCSFAQCWMPYNVIFRSTHVWLFVVFIFLFHFILILLTYISQLVLGRPIHIHIYELIRSLRWLSAEEESNKNNVSGKIFARPKRKSTPIRKCTSQCYVHYFRLYLWWFHRCHLNSTKKNDSECQGKFQIQFVNVCV